MPPSPHRRPGGQLGNLNALKHGFYTRRIHKHDLLGTEDASSINLAEEIALIRIFTRKIVDSSRNLDDLYELAGVLRMLCLASVSITRIIKAQALLNNDDSDLHEAIDEAIRRVNHELRSKPPTLPVPAGQPISSLTSKD